MILGEAHSSEAIFFAVIMVVFVVLFMANIAMVVRFYKKVPAGKVMVIQKLHMTQITRRGSLVLPLIWSHAFVHAEVEEVEFESPNGKETILLCLDDTDEAVMKAHTKFGEKPVDEIKHILKRMVQKSTDRDADLAKVGYTVVC